MMKTVKHPDFGQGNHKEGFEIDFDFDSKRRTREEDKERIRRELMNLEW